MASSTLNSRRVDSTSASPSARNTRAHLLTEFVRAAVDACEYLTFFPGAEALLRRGIHFTERAAIPGAAVGQRQDQRLRFARWAKYRFNVKDRKVLSHAD